MSLFNWFGSAVTPLDDESKKVLMDLDYIQKYSLICAKAPLSYDGAPGYDIATQLSLFSGSRALPEDRSAEAQDQKAREQEAIREIENAPGVKTLLGQIKIPVKELSEIARNAADQRLFNAARTNPSNTYESFFRQQHREVLSKCVEKINGCQNVNDLKILLGGDFHLVIALATESPGVLGGKGVRELFMQDRGDYWVRLNLKFNQRAGSGVLSLFQGSFGGGDYDLSKISYLGSLARLHADLYQTQAPWSESLNAHRPSMFDLPLQPYEDEPQGVEEKKGSLLGSPSSASAAATPARQLRPSGQIFSPQAALLRSPERKRSPKKDEYTPEILLQAKPPSRVIIQKTVQDRVTTFQRVSGLISGDSRINPEFLVAGLQNIFPRALDWCVSSGDEKEPITQSCMREVSDFVFNQNDLLDTFFQQSDQKSAACYLSIGIDLLNYDDNFEVQKLSQLQALKVTVATLTNRGVNAILVIGGLEVFVNVKQRQYLVLSDAKGLDAGKKAELERLGKVMAEIPLVHCSMPSVSQNLDKNFTAKISQHLKKEQLGHLINPEFLDNFAGYLINSHHATVLQKPEVRSFKDAEIGSGRAVSSESLDETLIGFGNYLQRELLIKEVKADDGEEVKKQKAHQKSENTDRYQKIKNLLAHGIKNKFFITNPNALVALVKQHLDLTMDLLGNQFSEFGSVSSLLTGRHLLDILECQMARIHGRVIKDSIDKLFELVFQRESSWLSWFSRGSCLADKIVGDKELSLRLLKLIEVQPSIGRFLAADEQLAASFIGQLANDDENLQRLNRCDPQLFELFKSQSTTAKTSWFFGDPLYSQLAIEKLAGFQPKPVAPAAAAAAAPVVAMDGGSAQPAKPEVLSPAVATATAAAAASAASGAAGPSVSSPSPASFSPSMLVGDHREEKDDSGQFIVEASKCREQSHTVAQARVIFNFDGCQQFAPDSQVIGRGAYSIVYGGALSGKDVAIKTPTDNPFALIASHRETVYLSKLQHPRIVQLYGVYAKKDALPCLVMELMPKGTLTDLLRNPQQIPWKTRYSIAIDVAAALEYMHSQGIAHNDIKSGNVLLDGNLRAKLGDLGSATDENNSVDRNSGGLRGTIQWMAPERLSDSCRDSFASDMYSFCMVMWELATGKTPFQAIEAAVVARESNGTQKAHVEEIEAQVVSECRASLKEQIESEHAGASPEPASEQGSVDEVAFDAEAAVAKKMEEQDVIAYVKRIAQERVRSALRESIEDGVQRAVLGGQREAIPVDLSLHRPKYAGLISQGFFAVTPSGRPTVTQALDTLIDGFKSEEWRDEAKAGPAFVLEL